ncbi:polyketide synthase [Colletotrichum higginsianum]|nr:polyketide synthase [Colletotrichum higginsianum]
MAASPKNAPSAAFFCPVPFLVDKTYLTQLRRQIVGSSFMKPLADAILQTLDVWKLLASDPRAQHVAVGARGEAFAKAISEWIATGETGVVASQPSSIISFPLLIITGLCQWCSFLELSGQSHEEAIGALGAGGIQGYCGGILNAIAVASSGDSLEFGRRAANMYRTAFLLGVFMSEGEVGPPEGVPDMLIVRLKYPGQDLELMEQFPGIYASATTNPVTICFAGKKSELAPLKEYVAANKMFSIQTYPTGTGHDPRNAKYLDGMLAIVAENDFFHLPAVDALKVPVQSNVDGELLQLIETPAAFARDVLGNVLCGRCEWYQVVGKVAARLRQHDDKSTHSLLLLGGYDCVPAEPFNQASIRIAKIDVALTLREVAQVRAELASYSGDDAVAVVGAACRLPGASNLDELWDLLQSGTSRCEELRPDRVPLSASHRASLDPKFANGRKWFGNFVDGVDQFDNELFGISHSEAAWMDPQQRILLELTYEALDSYGHLGHRSYSRQAALDVGCFIGGTLIEYNEHTSTHAATAYSAIGTMQAFQCGRISHHFGWYGPSETIDTACSSSLVAISRAAACVRAGDCSMAVAGGANILGGVNYYLDLAKARFLSPTGQCKPFDAAADGYCRADGAGLVVLKKLKDAVASGDQILAVIPAAGTNQGGLSKSITQPDGQAQERLYRRVVGSAGLDYKDISYIECHGTGTQAGDPNELGALRSVFGDAGREKKLFVGSVKGNIGHPEAAAGVAGLMKVLTMLREGKIPPQGSFENVNPSIGPLEPFNMAIPAGTVQPWDAPGNVRRALVNSYGAAGSNASLVVCQAPRQMPQSAWWLRQHQKKEGGSAPTDASWPLIVTAATKTSLASNCLALAEMVRSDKPDLRRLSWTLGEKRQRHRFRVVLPVTSNQDPEEVAAALEKAAQEPAPTPSPKSRKGVVLVFGGQSQRTVHLDPHLYEASPRLRHHLAECDALLQQLGYPPVVKDVLDHSKVDQSVLLLQTATFAIQYSCARTWEDAGLKVDAVVGHSFGELTALAFSGALSLLDGIRVVAERAMLMQTAWGQEKGQMLAIHAPLETVRAITQAVDGLEIACHNSAASHVVVGTAQQIERCEAIVAEQFNPVRCQKVDVTHGFHSKFVDDILPGLQKLDDSLDFQKPRMRLELCLPAHHEGEPPKGHIGRHARNPVFFEDAITRLAQALGPSVWLEAGTDSPIIPMAKRVVPDAAAHSFYPFNFKAARHPETVLCQTTVGLWRSGVDTTYWPLIEATDIEPVQIPAYRFSRKSFWTEYVDHAADIKTQLEQALQQSPPQQQQQQQLLPSAASKLVNISEPGSNRFHVNVSSGRFQQLVRGHAVCDQPMCPASMYMECVSAALQISVSTENHLFPGPGGALRFESVAFNHPLTLSNDLQVSVVLNADHDSGGRSWTFVVESTGGKPSGRSSVHARGRVAIVPSPNMHHIKALIGDRSAQLRTNPHAECIQSRRAYTLFSTLVDYSHVLRGIDSVALHDNWAVGIVKPPRQLVALHETDRNVLGLADAAVADNFVQVLGLAINTSEHVSPGSAYILSSIDSFTLSAGCCLVDDDTAWWTVTSHYSVGETPKSITGDIYVADKNGDVVATVLGACFSLVQLDALRRVLNAAAAEPEQKPPSYAPGSPATSLGFVDRPVAAAPYLEPSIESTASRPPQAATAPPPALEAEPQPPKNDAVQPESQATGDDVGLKVRDVVAKYTGAIAGEMPLDSTMTELGIDSLAIVEFAEKVFHIFKKQFVTDDLGNMSLQALIDACYSAGAAVTGGTLST